MSVMIPLSRPRRRFDMARPRKQESIEKKILDAETRVATLRKEYDEALSQLKLRIMEFINRV